MVCSTKYYQRQRNESYGRSKMLNAGYFESRFGSVTRVLVKAQLSSTWRLLFRMQPSNVACSTMVYSIYGSTIINLWLVTRVRPLKEKNTKREIPEMNFNNGCGIGFRVRVRVRPRPLFLFYFRYFSFSVFLFQWPNTRASSPSSGYSTLELSINMG